MYRRFEALKTCPQCGCFFSRKRFWRGRLEDYTAFQRRKFCCRGCANRGRMWHQADSGVTRHPRERQSWGEDPEQIPGWEGA